MKRIIRAIDRLTSRQRDAANGVNGANKPGTNAQIDGGTKRFQGLAICTWAHSWRGSHLRAILRSRSNQSFGLFTFRGLLFFHFIGISKVPLRKQRRGSANACTQPYKMRREKKDLRGQPHPVACPVSAIERFQVVPLPHLRLDPQLGRVSLSG